MKFDYARREQRTIDALTDKYGSPTGEVLHEQFAMRYQVKKPFSMNMDITKHYEKRAEMFDRYISRYWKVKVND